jgi:outer membrane protein assembly factor BamB
MWKFKTGGSISAIVAVGDEFVVLSTDNFVYSLNAKNGGLNWKRRLQGRVAHYALAEGLLIVSTFDQHGASAIDLKSGRVVGQVVLDSEDAFTTDPVVMENKLAVATNSGIRGYSLGTCGTK